MCSEALDDDPRARPAVLAVGPLRPPRYEVSRISMWHASVQAHQRHLSVDMRCNFCGSEFPRFAQLGLDHETITRLRIIGAGVRPNAMCLKCRSVDRERHVALFLNRHTSLFSRFPGRLLHVAPEMRLGARLRHALGMNYVSIDLAAPRARGMIAMDVGALGFPSEMFEAVICNHVLEHVVDDVAAMRELWRVMKPGGWAILQVPISLENVVTYEDARWQTDEDRIREFGQADHVRLYARDYEHRLQDAGFDVESTSSTEALGHDTVREYSLIENEPLFIARRPIRSKWSEPTVRPRD